MGYFYSSIVLMLLACTFGISAETDPSGRQFEDVIEKLLRNLLSNGLPGTNMTLDPLVLENLDVSQIELPGVMSVVHLGSTLLNVIGLSNFTTNYLTFTIVGFKCTFNLTFEVQGTGTDVDLNIIVGDILPVTGNGTLTLNTTITLSGSLAIGVNGLNPIYLKDLVANIDFNVLEIGLDYIMGADSTSSRGQRFIKLLKESTPEIIGITLPSVLEMLADLVNGFFVDVGLTTEVLLDCLRGESTCPFDFL